MSIDVSIVLSCFKRGRQLRKTLESICAQKEVSYEIIVVEHGEDGLTESLAKSFGARYYQKDRTDLPKFQNPSAVHNIGIKRAKGKIVLLMGGEVMFNSIPHGLRDLVAPVLKNSRIATTALVRSLDIEGRFEEWYSHPSEGPRAGWVINFCLAVSRDALMTIGGFEESYTQYGYED